MTDDKPENPNAFPHLESDGYYGDPGMSLRDWFAGRFLQGMISDISMFEALGISSKNESLSIEDGGAAAAYAFADAMLKQREKK